MPRSATASSGSQDVSVEVVFDALDRLTREHAELKEMYKALCPPGGRAPKNSAWNRVAGPQGGVTFDVDAVQTMRSANHVIVVPDIPLIQPGVPPSRGFPVEFRTGGRRGPRCEEIEIIGLRGSVTDDTPGSEGAGDYELASMQLQLQTNNGLLNFVTNGSTGTDFVRYSDLFAGSLQFLPLGLVVPTATTINCFFQNLQPATTGHQLRPTLAFFCRIPDGSDK